MATETTLLALRTPLTLRLTRGRRTLLEVAVEDVNQASAAWCRYRDARGFGAPTAPRAELLVDGIVRGHISYNGKVWEGPTWKPGQRPVYDPAQEVANA